MRTLQQLLLIALQAVSLVEATLYGLPGESNGTAGYVLVDPSELTPEELVTLRAVQKEHYRKIRKRNGGDCISRTYQSTVLVGNGNPHQNQNFQQVTGNEQCSGGGQVQYATTTDVSWSVNVGAAYSWISGGFAVSESFSKGSSYTFACQPWDTEVCAYQAVVVTAYTVINQICEVGCGFNTCHDQGNSFIIYSPNSNQFGGCFIKGTTNRVNCGPAVGSCPGQGDGFLKPCGPVGGPGSTLYCPSYIGQTSECNVACQG